MFKQSRLFGAILLISGTAIGAGMLALPVFSGFGGFMPAALLLGAAWLFMFYTAWLLLNANLATAGEPNMISMVGKSLGIYGKIACWVSYLLLLYSLLSAYIAGASPIVLDLFNAMFHTQIPGAFGPAILLVTFGIFVYLGTRLVDGINRFLMLGLVVSYFLLVLTLPPHVQATLLGHIDFPATAISLPVLFTAFGFHIVIPSLTTYLRHDRAKLLRAIFIGSLIPLIVYLLWDLFVLGIVPIPQLAEAFQSGQSGAQPLAAALSNRWIGSAASAFAFFAIITSFLGVSLSLSDFLADGLKLKGRPFEREVACLLTFVPPIVFVYAYPRGFLLALQFAGVMVAILLGILPSLMAWKLPAFKSRIRRAGLVAAIACSLLILVVAWLDSQGALQQFIEQYVST